MTQTPYVIFITGANGIIGSATCQVALEKGYKVAAVDICFDKMESLLRQYSDSLLLLSCDVRVKSNIEKAMDSVLTKWDRIDGLFNNAAWKGNNLEEFFQDFEKYSMETWREILSVNLDAVMLVDQVIGSHMAKVQNYGSIVHTSSIYGISAPDQRIYDGSSYLDKEINTPAVYSASKGAVIALNNYLASYWGKNNVRVNCISPGGVLSGQNNTFQKKYSEKVPLKRMALAKEISEAAIFLLSPKASYINGHNLVIDGGFTIW